MPAAMAALAFAFLVVPSEAGLRYGISFSGSVQNYAMGAVGPYLEDWGRENNTSGFFAAGSAEEKDSNTGATGAFRVTVPGHVIVALEYTALSGRAKILEQDPFQPSAFPPYGAEINLSANAFTATVGYMPLSWGAFRVGAGVGGGYYVATGDRKTFVTGDGNATYDWKGHGWGIHGMALAEREWNQRWGIQIAAGYRSAKTSTLEEDGRQVRTSYGQDVNLDWSGTVLSLGLFLNLSR